MKNVFFITCIIFASAYSISFAGGCGCGSISAMHAITRSRIIASVNSHTTSEANAIRSEILLAAQNIIGTMKTNNASLLRMIQSLKESNAALIKSTAMAQETLKSYDLYGSPSANPQSLCGSTNVGAGVQVAAQAASKLGQTMRQKQINFSDLKEPSVKRVYRILDPSHPTVEEMTDAIFPANLTLTEEQLGDAQETIKTIGNPHPSEKLTEDQESSPGGQPYAASRIIHQARITMAMDTMNQHVAYHAPTLPNDVADWAKTQWEAAGASGNPPGLVEGKMSEAALYNMLSQMRIGNPNWGSQIASANEAGLLREQLMMQAVHLELTRKNNEFLDQLRFLTALDFVSRMEGTDGPRLSEAYSTAVGAQQ